MNTRVDFPMFDDEKHVAPIQLGFHFDFIKWIIYHRYRSSPQQHVSVPKCVSFLISLGTLSVGNCPILIHTEAPAYFIHHF